MPPVPRAAQKSRAQSPARETIRPKRRRGTALHRLRGCDESTRFRRGARALAWNVQQRRADAEKIPETRKRAPPPPKACEKSTAGGPWPGDHPPPCGLTLRAEGIVGHRSSGSVAFAHPHIEHEMPLADHRVDSRVLQQAGTVNRPGALNAGDKAVRPAGFPRR